MKLKLIKLGGASITDKTKLHTINMENIEFFAEELAKWYSKNSSTWRVCLISGAGSFGHFEAKEYGLAQGFSNWATLHSSRREEITVGISKCKAALIKLQSILVECFNRFKLPVTSVSIFGKSWEQIKQELSYIYSLDMIPLLHGDVILDEQRGCKICSGDFIAQWVASNFKAIFSTIKVDCSLEKVIFFTNVKGVYHSKNVTLDFSNENTLSKYLVKTIQIDPTTMDLHYELYQEDTTNTTALSCQQLEHNHQTTIAVDVTGGMKAKLESAIQIAQLHYPVFIASLSSRTVVQELLNNDEPNYQVIQESTKIAMKQT